MDNFIRALYVAHFEDLLGEETEPTQRSVLLTLLAKEKANPPPCHVGNLAPGPTKPRWTGL
jgi:hypothetical protein